jgi:Cu/Ag efflux pump CusA
MRCGQKSKHLQINGQPILMVVVGVVAMLSLPTAHFPNIADPQIQVIANYRGADAQAVTRQAEAGTCTSRAVSASHR